MALNYRQTSSAELNQFQEEVISELSSRDTGQFPPFGRVLEDVQLTTSPTTVETGVPTARYALILRASTTGVSISVTGGGGGSLTLTGSGAATVSLWVF